MKTFIHPYIPAVKIDMIVAAYMNHLNEGLEAVVVHRLLICTKYCSLDAVKQVWENVTLDSGRPAALLERSRIKSNNGRGVILALYKSILNLIHSFIHSDESMTDIQ